MVAGLLVHGGAQSQTQTPSDAAPTRLAPVVVTATRTDTPAFDVPASIDRIDGDAARDGRLQVNISDALGSVPGLLARDRQNYAQDVQISVRGFGARSTFGIRGVRLYVDGIPATLPDGQGQITNVDLGSVGRFEVLRGPFSALYGNSSGGVIQVFPEEPAATPTLGFGIAAGSDDALRISSKFSATSGAFGVVASASRFTTSGYREHSAAERRIGNLKLTWQPDDASKLTLIANHVALPKAEDPLGLTRAQFEANPRGVDPVATAFDTRKTVDQTQGGLIYDRRIDAGNALRIMVYGGKRETEQFQSIPVAVQANPLHPGGVISLVREYSGADLRWTLKTPLADRPFTLVGGLNYDALREQRRGYRNFVGSTLGVQGDLRRDEINEVSNLDPYLQASWQFATKWTLNAGVRRSSVRFTSSDRFIAGTNLDDSGAARYSATLPVVGVMFALSDSLRLYATAGRGFETPTLNELAYRPGGATGLNFALNPARSDSIEVGAKARTADFGEWRAAVFHTGTSDEIVTLTNTGGRSTFTNAGATRRRGLELAWSGTFATNLNAQAAYTLLDARYRDAFAGNRIPGIARSSLYLALGWQPPQGWRAGMDLRALSRVMVNDANSDAAAGHAVIGASAGYVWRAGRWELNGFVRGDNLAGRTVVGSVIVNEGNSRFFEPAPGRTWLAGAGATLAF
ncbi:MAG: TonB-dependent receptor [Rhizobiales bacterium]|nr:TonB-dependent receptor [Rhizobacter sp.]